MKAFVPTILLGTLVVSGCGAGLPYVIAGVGTGASIMLTKKTPVDHAISWKKGEDCSALRSEKGLSYCKEGGEAVAADPQPQVYCRKTLGDVECYALPDEQAEAAMAPRIRRQDEPTLTDEASRQMR